MLGAVSTRGVKAGGMNTVRRLRGRATGGWRGGSETGVWACVGAGEAPYLAGYVRSDTTLSIVVGAHKPCVAQVAPHTGF